MVDENRQGVDLIAMLNTFKGERTIELSKKWINDIPILAKDRIRKSTFDDLGCPQDMDLNCNIHLIPEAAIATQTHRQRILHLNHEEMISILARASTEVIADHETSEALIA